MIYVMYPDSAESKHDMKKLDKAGISYNVVTTPAECFIKDEIDVTCSTLKQPVSFETKEEIYRVIDNNYELYYQVSTAIKEAVKLCTGQNVKIPKEEIK